MVERPNPVMLGTLALCLLVTRADARLAFWQARRHRRRAADMRRTGMRPLALGAVLWATAGISCLLLRLLTGQL